VEPSIGDQLCRALGLDPNEATALHIDVYAPGHTAELTVLTAEAVARGEDGRLMTVDDENGERLVHVVRRWRVKLGEPTVERT
jgi:hypothetical protein